MINWRVYVVNPTKGNAIVSCGSREDAENEFGRCHSIEGGPTYLQGWCPLVGWVIVKSKI